MLKFFILFALFVNYWTFVQGSLKNLPKTFRSPVVVGIGAYEAPLYDYGLFDFKSGLIVNETMILSWGHFASDLWVVTQDKYILDNNIESLIDDEESGSQFRKVRNVTQYPCLLNSLKLSLFELDTPLVFSKFVQPGWFHSNPKPISNQNDAISYVIGWIQNQILKTLDQVRAVRVKISPACDPVEGEDEAPSICVEKLDASDHQCFYEGAGLAIKEKDGKKAYLAGILYPNQNKCNSKLKFLDLTKLACWIGGTVNNERNCTESVFEPESEVCDLNMNYIAPRHEKGEGDHRSGSTENLCPECNSAQNNNPILYTLQFTLFLHFT